MSEQELSPLSGEKVGTKKELRKRERKLTERLQEAQQEQVDALERLRRAEIRMRKRMARVQSLEDSLNIVHQQLEALQAPHATVVTMIASSPKTFAAMIEAPSVSAQEEELSEVESDSVIYPGEEDEAELVQMVAGEAELHYLERFEDMHFPEVLPLEEHIRMHEMQHWESGLEDTEVGPDNDEIPASEISIGLVVKQAREARAVAEAAEEAARIAVERAASVEEYLEQVGSVRHLMQEFERLQREAEEAIIGSREAEEAALIAERLLDSTQEEAHSEGSVMLSIEDESPDPIAEMNVGDFVQPGEATGLPSSLEVAQVEEIEEEEEDLETVTAMIIADAAATAAAQAEAIAEGCSARTREARAFVFKADQALNAVRDAIGKQKLRGEGAEVALKAAEREATHAHAALADAEAAEEHALNMAMNAEAEAEVAEGMAFAASSRDERDERLRNQNTFMQPAASHIPLDARTNLNSDAEFDDDDTLELPVVHPKKG